ncbi:fimbrial protein [Enterobacter sp. CC120223-11]|uniref:fimbrial protein n=1 Tax=Enterobacter sp. CC120223-11 TaxID=1378073 RepID=UPI000BD27F72|nr:fimbrial protein [Enterobacter sp. CC120223-11]SNY80310.1 major type 1 subunit fimbrin (pilin) [Enterobacter sp. CC120223-11]
MKTLFFVSTLSAALFSLNVSANQNVTLSLEGEFLSGTCDVGINDGAADATVTLPVVEVQELNRKKIAGTTPFHFTYTNCSWPSTKTVQVYFEGGSSVDTSTYYLKNTGGSATGVELVLNTPGGNDIHPGTDTQAGGDSFPSGSYTSGDFKVSYITTDTLGAATPGSVTSYVVYHLDYQ